MPEFKKDVGDLNNAINAPLSIPPVEADVLASSVISHGNPALTPLPGADFQQAIVLFSNTAAITDPNAPKNGLFIQCAKENTALKAHGKISITGDVSMTGNVTTTGNLFVTGDINLTNADFAEDFEIIGEDCDPGTVMVLSKNGALEQSSKAYDKKVAGILSGAGNFKPGIILDRHKHLEGRMPLAMMGKVYCKVDADIASIEVGDLLTTSNTFGHAMKAVDRDLAFGTVIGKALQPMEKGKGMISVLVSLQ